MATWQQEVSEATTALEEVNAVTVTLCWNISVQIDPDSTLPIPDDGVVKFPKTLIAGAPEQVNASLVDGKNFIAGDCVIELAWLTYLNARNPLDSDPDIISNGMLLMLDDVRPLGQDFGFDLGIDTLTVGADVWKIVNAVGTGWMNDENGYPQPASVILTLRK